MFPKLKCLRQNPSVSLCFVNIHILGEEKDSTIKKMGSYAFLGCLFLETPPLKEPTNFCHPLGLFHFNYLVISPSDSPVSPNSIYPASISKVFKGDKWKNWSEKLSCSRVGRK